MSDDPFKRHGSNNPEMAAKLAAVPMDKRHAIVCHHSGTMLFSDEAGIKPVLYIIGRMLDAQGEGEEDMHLFMIDLRDALVLKKSIDRTIEHLQKTGKDTT